MAALRIGKRRIKFRFFVFLAIIVIALSYLWNMSRQPKVYASVSYGDLTLEYHGQGLIIRDEEVFSAPAYGKITYIIPSGESVKKDQLIAYLYKEGFDSDIMNQLYEVQEKIMRYQQETIVDDVLNSDFKKINKELNTIIADIQSQILTSEYTAMDKKETKLRELMKNKQKYIDRMSTTDDYLQSLYNMESDLILKLEQWVLEINSQKPGILSYFVDGLENILGRTSVDKLTSEDYKDLCTRTAETEENTEAKAEQPLYKIVDPKSTWFLALEVNDKVYLDKGDTVDVQVFDSIDETVSGSVYRVNSKGDNSLIILEMNTDVIPFINKRTVSLKISKTVSGCIVPSDAIKKSRGRTGVRVKDREEHIFIETRVRGVTRGYAIVEPESLNQEINPEDKVVIR